MLILAVLVLAPIIVKLCGIKHKQGVQPVSRNQTEQTGPEWQEDTVWDEVFDTEVFDSERIEDDV